MLDIWEMAGISDLFRLDRHEDFAIALTLSPAFYLEYVLTETNVAYAVRCLSLLDQLELTLELLNDWREPEPELPSNVIRFRPRCSQ